MKYMWTHTDRSWFRVFWVLFHTALTPQKKSRSLACIDDVTPHTHDIMKRCDRCETMWRRQLLIFLCQCCDGSIEEYWMKNTGSFVSVYFKLFWLAFWTGSRSVMIVRLYNLLRPTLKTIKDNSTLEHPQVVTRVIPASAQYLGSCVVNLACF